MFQETAGVQILKLTVERSHSNESETEPGLISLVLTSSFSLLFHGRVSGVLGTRNVARCTEIECRTHLFALV